MYVELGWNLTHSTEPLWPAMILSGYKRSVLQTRAVWSL